VGHIKSILSHYLASSPRGKEFESGPLAICEYPLTLNRPYLFLIIIQHIFNQKPKGG